MLAAAIAAAASEGAMELLRMCPGLDGVPIAGEGGKTIMHLAAAVGDMRILSLLEQTDSWEQQHVLDHDTRPSIRVTHLGRDNNDVYIHQVQPHSGDCCLQKLWCECYVSIPISGILLAFSAF